MDSFYAPLGLLALGIALVLMLIGLRVTRTPQAEPTTRPLPALPPSLFPAWYDARDEADAVLADCLMRHESDGRGDA